LRSGIERSRSAITVAIRRLLRRTSLPGWSYRLETGADFLRRQMDVAFNMPDPAKAREYLDSLSPNSSSLKRVTIQAERGEVKGKWLTPPGEIKDSTLFYLPDFTRGFNSIYQDSLVAWIALAAESRAFIPEVRPIPEHPYPAQLEEADKAYQWLLDSGIAAERMVIAGDSAGGNLALALLLRLREDGLPLPALVVCLSPWVDPGNSGGSMTEHESFDWLEKRVADRWADWYCTSAAVSDPLISPMHANLHGLPPIFIQAGDAEIFFDMIRNFNEAAHKQGADVTLEVWEHMIHNFQAFGDSAIQSRTALAHVQKTIERAFRDNTPRKHTIIPTNGEHSQ
jgi:acetyl esterase/lipase